ncbi:MAG: hypothetical protein IKZ55_03765 [Bacteroidales bacterium]|nr:hypothetical protein [Bacteroidales bacterium]
MSRLDHSTTTFRVVPSNFTNQTPIGRSMVTVSVMSRVRMVCPQGVGNGQCACAFNGDAALGGIGVDSEILALLF